MFQYWLLAKQYDSLCVDFIVGGNSIIGGMAATLAPGTSSLSDASTSTTSAPGAAMTALSGAMASAEQQLQLLQQKQQQLIKLQYQVSIRAWAGRCLLMHCTLFLFLAA